MPATLDFRHEQTARAVPLVRLACGLGVFAFVSFAAIDPVLATRPLSELVFARSAVVAVLVALFALTFGAGAHRRIVVLGFAACLSIGIGVIWVALLTGGGESPYHQALVVLFFGATMLLPLGASGAAFCFVVLIVGYDAMLVATDLLGAPGVFIANNGILALSAIVAVSATVFVRRLSFHEFQNRQKLENANEQLKALDKAKSTFFANLTHELRTPLTLILAPLDALLRDDPRLPPELRDELDLCRRNGLRLLRLVDDLLMLTRLEAGIVRMRVETVDIARFVEDLVEQTRPVTRQKQLQIDFVSELPAGTRLELDPVQIERVVLNILANALKFTGEGGRIEARVRPAPDALEIAISDTGIGIPASELTRIFERFHQVDASSTRRYGGTGIGLALSKELVEQHGGTIHAESEAGKGTTIIVRLPRAVRLAPEALERRNTDRVVSKEQRAAEPGLPEWHEALRLRDEYRLQGVADAGERRLVPRTEVRGQRPTLLVVEDNPDMIKLIAGLLAAEYDVLAATDGASGLRLAKKMSPDIIVSDVMMPGMTGFELVRAVRSEPSIEQTPLVLLTALADGDARTEGRERGADAHLAKPFQPSELRATLRSLLKRQTRQVAAARTDREQALRVMSEGVAHEILNPLGFVQAAVTGLSEVAEDIRAASGATGEAIEALLADRDRFYKSAREGLSRVRLAVEELRRIARGTAMSEPVPTAVAAITDRLVTLLGGAAAVPFLACDIRARQMVDLRPGQLEQVLQNLVLNAQQAAKSDCRIGISAWDTDDGKVAIAVEDNGPGIPRQDLERIFYPYFTTKKPGEGTGMGLAVARNIVREHGGTLDVQSEIGKGAVFTITLPASSRQRDAL